jgi:hypothetical protein
MIELAIAACLFSGECRDFGILYDAREVSLMTCMIAGQPEVARWQAEHPLWRVERWHCAFADTRSADL